MILCNICIECKQMHAVKKNTPKNTKYKLKTMCTVYSVDGEWEWNFNEQVRVQIQLNSIFYSYNKIHVTKECL